VCPAPRAPSSGRPFFSISLRADGAGGMAADAAGAGSERGAGASAADVSNRVGVSSGVGADWEAGGRDGGACGGVPISLVGADGEPTGCETAPPASCVFAAADAFTGGAAARSVIDPSTEPTATFAPCGTFTSDSTPATGAGTSSVTLSV